jgi:hypothetical protein
VARRRWWATVLRECAAGRGGGRDGGEKKSADRAHGERFSHRALNGA